MGAAETRQCLSDYHSFLSLAFAIANTHDRRANEFRLTLDRTSEFLTTASDQEVRERGEDLERLLAQAVEGHGAFLPRKKPVREIARDFRLLANTESDV